MLGLKLSQQILKDTYRTKNQNKIKVSENWGEKNHNGSKKSKGNEKILKEKKENKSTTFQNLRDVAKVVLREKFH